MASDLKIKTFKSDNEEEVDRLCNEFGKKYSVRATHTNPTYDFHQKKIIYIYTLFYAEQVNLKELTQKMKEESQAEPEVKRIIPKKILAEDEAKWTNCNECKSRWKWTHYRLCPQKHGLNALPEEFREEYMEIWGNGNGNGNKDLDKGN